MKKLYIGSALILLAAILFVVCGVEGVPRNIAYPVNIILATVGFLLQMAYIFSVQNNHRKEMTLLKKQSDEKLKKISELPPEEAIRVLLGERYE